MAENPFGKFAAAKKKHVKGAATDLNKYSLFEHLKGEESGTNQVDPSSAEGIRRAMKAGLAKIEGKKLVLTEEGKKEQRAYEQKAAPERLERAKRRLNEHLSILDGAEKFGNKTNVGHATRQVAKWKQEVADAERAHAKLSGESSSAGAGSGLPPEPDEMPDHKLDEKLEDKDYPPPGTAAKMKEEREKGDSEKAPDLKLPPAAAEKISTEEKKADPKLSKLMQAHDDAYMRAKYAGSEAERRQGQADLDEHKARISKHVAESHKKEAADDLVKKYPDEHTKASQQKIAGQAKADAEAPKASSYGHVGSKSASDLKAEHWELSKAGAHWKGGGASEAQQARFQEVSKELKARKLTTFGKLEAAVKQEGAAGSKVQTADAGNMLTKPAPSSEAKPKAGGQNIQTGAKGGRYYHRARAHHPEGARAGGEQDPPRRALEEA